MKALRELTCFLSVVFVLAMGANAHAAQSAPRKTRVACVGNSITYGAYLNNREKNSYPAQLQYFLGDKYEVRNFGVSGRCVLHNADYPYTQTDEYRKSLDFLPDIVLIGFGTNDSKPVNWAHHADFYNDYQKIIATYRNLPSRPRVILLTPLSCFVKPVNNPNAVDSAKVADFFVPQVQQIAYDNDLEVIDMHHMFADAHYEGMSHDRLHPTAIGAGDIARRIGVYLLRGNHKAKPAPSIEGASDFNFYGYSGKQFAFDGVEARIVSPRLEAKGRPWVWRARFWGHQPQTDIGMLEAGFHVVYCDVSNLYGQKPAIERWNKFYKQLQKWGFNKKCVLEGMSRGGLIAYNWAAQNPGRVAAIYADAPVLDLMSWPVASEKRHGEQGVNTRQLMQLVGAQTEDEIKTKALSPLALAPTLAKAKIPIIHVVGEADDVVPVGENTDTFAREMERLGHPITVIRKPGCNHHPHSLPCPRRIVRFLLKACGEEGTMVPTHAVPANEYRGSWMKDYDWHRLSEALTRVASEERPQLLFVGNSITQGWGASLLERGLVTYESGGKDIMDSIMGRGNWDAFGIQGDRTQNVLWRLRNGGYGKMHPRFVVIAIGVNNLWSGEDFPDEVAAGIKACTEEALRQFPDAHVMTVGVFPCGALGSDLRKGYEATRAALLKMRWGKAKFIDMKPLLVGNDGNLLTGCYGSDNIHLEKEGYRVWAKCVTDWMDSFK